MKKLLFVLLIGVSLNLSAQTVYQKTYGTLSYSDRAACIRETSDSGFLMLGVRKSPVLAIQLIRINKSGDTVWMKHYMPEGLTDLGLAMHVYSGDSILIKAPLISQRGLFIMKCSPNGDSVWGKRFAHYGQAGPNSISAGIGGGFMLLGLTDYGSDRNSYLLRINSNGDSLWSMTFGAHSTVDSFGHSLIALHDGYVICGGMSGYTGSSYIIKIADNGQRLWTTTHRAGTKENYAVGMEKLPNNNILVVGRCHDTTVQYADISLITLDPAGNVISSKKYGSNGYDFAVDVVRKQNGTTFIAAYSNGYSSFDDFVLIKTDSAGNEIWTRTYGIASAGESLKSMILCRNGNLALFGERWGLSIDFFLVMANDDGFTSAQTSAISGIQLYPNPCRSIVTLSGAERIETVKIISVLGKEVRSMSPAGTGNTLTINVEDLSPGTYFLLVQHKERFSTIRFIKD